MIPAGYKAFGLSLVNHPANTIHHQHHHHLHHIDFSTDKSTLHFFSSNIFGLPMLLPI